MSKFYGTLSSDKGDTTRAGNRYISAAAQSFDGSIIVSINGDDVDISVAEGSRTYGRTLFSGKLSDLLAAKSLCITKNQRS